jgi:hypothetical protein
MTIDEGWKLSLQQPDVNRSPFSKGRFIDDRQHMYMMANATESDRRLDASHRSSLFGGLASLPKDSSPSHGLLGSSAYQAVPRQFGYSNKGIMGLPKNNYQSLNAFDLSKNSIFGSPMPKSLLRNQNLESPICKLTTPSAQYHNAHLGAPSSGVSPVRNAYHQ